MISIVHENNGENVLVAKGSKDVNSYLNKIGIENFPLPNDNYETYLCETTVNDLDEKSGNAITLKTYSIFYSEDKMYEDYRTEVIDTFRNDNSKYDCLSRPYVKGMEILEELEKEPKAKKICKEIESYNNRMELSPYHYDFNGKDYVVFINDNAKKKKNVISSDDYILSKYNVQIYTFE